MTSAGSDDDAARDGHRLGRLLASWTTAGSAPPRLPPRGGRIARALRRPVVADCAVTAVALFLGIVDSVKNPYLGPAAPWLNIVIAVVAALPLLARRRLPEVVLALSLIGYVSHVSVFSVFFAAYAEGAYRGPRRRSFVCCAAMVMLLVLAPWQLDWSQPRHLVAWLAGVFVLMILMPLLFGLYVGERRAVLGALVDRAERAEREQSLIGEAARTQERQRIAGEMHDVVSHQVSLMVVHANALQYVADDPAAAKETASTIQTAGRQALDELREMIGVLRRSPVLAGGAGVGSAGGNRSAGGNGSGTGTGDRPVETAPVTVGDGPVAGSGAVPSTGPSLSHVPALVEASRAAGLPVELVVTGEPGPLTEAAERAAYRVIQEALTNVHKHAAGAATEVAVAHGAGSLRVRVTNATPPRPRSGEVAAQEPLLPSGGHGLIGLRERVRLAGGGIETGVRPGGGFRVVAELPFAAGAGGA